MNINNREYLLLHISIILVPLLNFLVGLIPVTSLLISLGMKFIITLDSDTIGWVTLDVEGDCDHAFKKRDLLLLSSNLVLNSDILKGKWSSGMAQ